MVAFGVVGQRCTDQREQRTESKDERKVVSSPHIAVVHLGKENEAEHGHNVGPVEHLQQHSIK